MKRERLLILVILAAAAACRVYFAADLPLTLDEAWSNLVGKMPLPGLLETAWEDISPPLTYLAHKYFTVSDAELGIRWVFLLLSSFSLFYIARLRRPSIPLLLIFASSAYLMAEGAIARMHALNLLFAAGACWHYAMTFEREKLSDFVLLGVFCLLGLYNFYPFGALPAAFSAVYLAFRKESASRPAYYGWTIFFAGLLALPLAFFAANSSAGQHAAQGFVDIPSGAILAYLPFALAYSESLLRFGEIRGTNILYFLLLSAAVLPVLAAGALRRENGLRGRLLLWVAVISVVIVFAVSLRIPKVLYSAKYISWIYPVFIYFMASGLESLPGRVRSVLLTVIVIVNLAAAYTMLERNPENWRDVAAFVRGSEKAGDILLFDAGHMRYPFNFYYRGGAPVVGLPADPSSFEPGKYMRYNRVWLIAAHNWDRAGVYRELLSRQAAVLEEYPLGDIKVLLFEVRQKH